MNLTRDRVRSIGWAFVLSVCAALTAGLTLRVNAVRSQVYQSEERIVSLKHNIRFLETEFQTRANQQQLKALNDVEFGYTAPLAEQYIEGERQLAALGKARAPGAPQPIRVAAAPDPAGQGQGDNPFMAMVSPIAGIVDSSSSDSGAAPRAAEAGDAGKRKAGVAGLPERLARIELPEAGGE